MWFSLLKQPELGMANVGLVDLSNVPEEEQRDDCNRQLKEYSNKIKALKLGLADGYNSERFKGWKKHFKLTVNKEDKIRITHTDDNPHPMAFYEDKYSWTSQLPEPVACKALELLKGATQQRGYGEYNAEKHSMEIGDKHYDIIIRFAHDYQYIGLELLVNIVIGGDVQRLIHIGYVIGEDSHPLKDVGEWLDNETKYNAIGFYDLAKKNMDWR